MSFCAFPLMQYVDIQTIFHWYTLYFCMRDWSTIKFMYVATLIGSHIQDNHSLLVPSSPYMLNDIVISGYLFCTQLEDPLGLHVCFMYWQSLITTPHQGALIKYGHSGFGTFLTNNFDNFVYGACI